ncbi:hypothetical protein V6248_19875, partial [Pseudoalteromonas agarivorans]|uniref:hypothetical protein n=1 Tax=Pseudoalteromonas agarivorans TaxID=176102 RepID=UPI00311E544F
QSLSDSQLGDDAQSKLVINKLEKSFTQVAKLPELTNAIKEYNLAYAVLCDIQPAEQLSHYDDSLNAFNSAFKAAR